MSSFTVRPYEPGDEEQILALFNRVFDEAFDVFEPRKLETWRHIYLANPAGHQIFVAEDADKNLIANYSAISGICSVRGEKRPCSQPVDTCVAKEWRGSLRRGSVFVTLAHAFVEHFCTTGADFYNEYMFGLPNENAFGVGTRIIGYQPVACPMPVQVKDVGDDWIEELYMQSGGLEVVGAEGHELPEIEALFERHVEEDVPLGLWRDASYLSWRYVQWPDVDYRAALARRDGELVGACVYRVGWADKALVPIVDWIVPGADRKVVAGLLACVAHVSRNEGMPRLETWALPDTPLYGRLHLLGMREEPTFFNLCIMTFSTDFDVDWAKDNWFLTMGDSDIY